MYQVVDRVTLYPDLVTALGTLSSAEQVPSNWQLPLTLLDGALQVDSIARAGFERTGGLPRTIGRIAWTSGLAQARTLECVARVQLDHPHQPGEIVLLDVESRTPRLVVSDFRTTASLACLRPEKVSELAS
jgi:hypothetical protein